MRRQSALRTNAAGLKAQLIEPAMLGARFPKPVGRERLLRRAGEHQIAQRTLDGESDCSDPIRS